MMQEKEVLRLALHMSLALEHAHANGVLHRDIKPSNIIVSKADRVPKLCDFGLAKDIAFDPKATRAGVVLGTPHYISPEQIRGAANDIRSDIYSLGATLYHCLCGEAPFASDGAANVMIKHLTEPPEPVRSKRAEVSQETAWIIEKMLEKEPERRFQTPGGLRHALEPLVYNAGGAPPGPPPAAKKTVKRRGRKR
jgi:serine/threonine protein kinase